MKVDKKWLVIWGIIYAIILTSNFIDPRATWTSGIKILGIFLCFIYALIEKKSNKLLALAMGLTFLADLVLLVNNVSLAGVVIFCAAQFIHTTRLAKMKLQAFVTYAIFLLGVFFLAIHAKIDAMYAVGFVYAVTLFSNIILSVKWSHDTGEIIAKLSVVGFLLFMSCDLCVVVSYLSLTRVLPFLFYAPANYLAWVFYYPSQVFISNSSKTVVQ